MTVAAPRALSLWQPYASLMVLRAPATGLPLKSIETRSWATSYRGPVVIHAAKRMPPLDIPLVMAVAEQCGASFMAAFSATNTKDTSILPRGMVVGSGTLTDVVPMVDRWPAPDGRRSTPRRPCLYVGRDHPMTLWRTDDVDEPGLDVEDQRPFGNYATGRYAHIYTDLAPTAERCPRCWGGEIRCTGWHGTEDDPAPCYGRIECGTCGDTGACEPVPMRGRQGLWTPTWEEAA